MQRTFALRGGALVDIGVREPMARLTLNAGDTVLIIIADDDAERVEIVRDSAAGSANDGRIWASVALS